MTYRTLIIIALTIAFYSISFGQSKNDSLYVFVGKKLSIKKAKQPKLGPDKIQFSIKYKLKFKIIQNIHNKLSQRTIVFYAGAHLGLRELPTNDNSLLFLSNNNGQYNLIRFQYFDVYKTTDRRWASCGDPFYSDEKYEDSVKTPIPFAKLDFPKPVTFKLNPTWDSTTVRQVFPEPYFKVEGLTATGFMGIYVEDLFVMKKKGILKQLGYFK